MPPPPRSSSARARLVRALCAALGALALTAAPARAEVLSHPFLGGLEGTGTPAGGFEDACGVAVDSQGNLYVADYYHHAVDIFDSSGEYAGQIAGEDPLDGPCNLAVDSSGRLYVNNFHRNVVKFTPSEIPQGPGIVIDSAHSTGVAVDAASGNVYVDDGTYIAEYGPSGSPVESGGHPVRIGLNPLASYYGVAVSDFPATAGYLYVPDAASHMVKVFDAGGPLIEEMDGSATPQGGFIYLTDAEVAVDNSPTSPSYGHLFVLDAAGHGKSEHPEAVLDEFNAAGAYRGQITGFTDAEPSGIAFQEGTHNVYVTSGNSEGSGVFVYGPTAPAHSLKVTKTGSGGGTVTSSPAGIDCGSACQAEFNEGQTVTLFAAPDASSTFSGWTVTGAEPCPGTGTCTVLLSNNVEVSASFAPAPPLPPPPPSSESAVAAPAAVSGALSAPTPTGAAQGQAAQAQGEGHGYHRAKRHRHRHHPHKTVTH